MRIEIASRKSIESRAQQPFMAGTALISCFDDELEPVNLENLPGYMLQLQFNDVGIEDFMDFDNSIPEGEEFSRLTQSYHMITEGQAKQLAEFYHSINDKAELLICQCEHGESRSTAIAAAITQHERGQGIEYFIEDRYFPNKTVYKAVYSALKSI